MFLGLVFVGFGPAGLLNLLPAQPMTGPAALFMEGMHGSYLFTLVKATEVVAGLMLLSNRFVPLALTLLAPVLVNIAAFHALYAPKGLGMVVVLLAAELHLAWKYRAAFVPMLGAKVTPASAAPAQSRVAFSA